jgi:hypothetical protein
MIKVAAAELRKEMTSAFIISEQRFNLIKKTI